MDYQQRSKNFRTLVMKYFLTCSLFLFIMQADGSSTADMKCEIKSSCSGGCESTEPMTVDPDSNVTLNCSITERLELGMTWKRLANRTNSSELYLYRWSSINDKNYSCVCTAILFTHALKIVDGSSSPNDIVEGKETSIECVFSGWPLPTIVHWFKEEKLITNGTDGIYHSMEKEGNNLRSTLYFPSGQEDQEGFYKCNANNSIPGWSSSAAYGIEMILWCPSAQGPIIFPLEILASAFSNINLTCRFDFDGNCPHNVLWLKGNTTAYLENAKKYSTKERKTHTKCKNDYVLSIFNVTKNDEGRYTCHWECDEDIKTAVIDLKVSADLPTIGDYEFMHFNLNFFTLLTKGGRQKWLLPIIILSAVGVAVIFMSVLRFGFKKKRTSSYKIQRQGIKEGDLINRLFISFSSKDLAWVNENLISIFEKHSIAYSIHSRDFELGRPIVQNMADNVYGSRQVLIVLSQNYLASNFCREELHMAVQRGIDSGDSSLILVMINSLKKKQLPAALRNKKMLDFDKHKKKQDWEEKILSEIIEGKTMII
ncbi:unnamed protein product [Pocillopora meandrina]|uniref:Uncharacterized protein n=1 Tax=Pocillopora meandrina TaxID=46732 RepID=A0AAU9WSC2_9CNID|nr:unnamed protein product [Pocillopora meandrina]